ncbi:GNAT family N-acetyltransferase [Glutamicibacter sp. Je.9.36]|uniref:GNAT family N-acetyltransferase n=1 Tax=Glutamicibacter sp. Je.9.36 TaxID=3142837 RepID=UPI003DA9FE2B
MFENLNFSLSSLCVQPAQRAELATLYPLVDQRWNQKFDRLSLLVTVRDQGTLVAAGLVHDSIIAPTSSMNAVELGCMAVRPDYRRLGIRQHATSLRLAHALRSGKTPISVIDSQNPASWAFYERSELWQRERSFEHDGQLKFIYRATVAAWQWAAQLPQASEDHVAIHLPEIAMPAPSLMAGPAPVQGFAAQFGSDDSASAVPVM